MSRYRTYTPNDDPPLMDGDEQFIGVNMRLEPDKVQPGFLAYGSQNLRFRNGEAGTRLGLAKPAWLNVCGNGSKIGRVGQFYGAGNFKDPASFEWVLTAADGNIYRHRPGNVRQSIALPTGVQILSTCSFAQAFGSVFCFRGRYLAPLVMSDVDTGFIDIEPLWNAATAYNAAVTALSSIAQEIAYGPFQTITTITNADKLVTVVTPVAHGYISGADATIQGAATTQFNGRFNIAVVDEFTFTYYAATAPASAAAGTPVCSNMSNYWQALGTRRTNSSIAWSSGTATATTSVNHGFTSGQYVTIAGASPTNYNGTYIITVTAGTTFTYALASDGGTTPASSPGTSTTSVTLAGQSPDTNPEAWNQIFNVLPNADDAVYINNRLIVPTAYTPAATGYNSTDVTYSKKDYLVATDSLDYIHFDFVNNEFRINEGSDDEIECVVVYNMTTLLIFKTKSWGIMTGIGYDLSQVSLNMFGATYGACALRSAVTAGEDVLFPSSKRGICSCYMTQLGQVRGTDTPFSNEMQKIVDRINWNYASGIRMAWWNDALYCAVPLDAATSQAEMMWAQTTIFDKERHSHLAQVWNKLIPGNQYYWSGPGDKSNTLTCGALTLTAAGYFVATVSQATGIYRIHTSRLFEVITGNTTLMVYDYRMGFSGSPLTYDFRGGQWAGIDVGPFCVMEFFKATVNGLERLFFIGQDGFVSMIEEHLDGDQVYNGSSPMGLSMQPIATLGVTRGYKTQDKTTPEGQRRWRRLNIVVSCWNASLSISGNTGAAFSAEQFVSGLTFDRTSYFKPFDAASWDNTNASADFQTPGRYDYSVIWNPAGTVLNGLNFGASQEITKRVSLRPLTGRYAQFAIASSQGRISIKAPSGEANEGARRNGVLI